MCRQLRLFTANLTLSTEAGCEALVCLVVLDCTWLLILLNP